MIPTKYSSIWSSYLHPTSTFFSLLILFTSKINMELLFAFEIENIFRNFAKWILSIWHYYIAAKMKNLLRRKFISGKLIWSSYLCSILTEFLEGILFFGKSIWTYYSKPRLMPFGSASRETADFAKTL